MATILQVTPDIAVNHKYVIVAVLLLNIFAAGYLFRFLTACFTRAKILAVLLVVLLTITGVVDLITLYNLDAKKPWNFGRMTPYSCGRFRIRKPMKSS